MRATSSSIPTVRRVMAIILTIVFSLTLSTSALAATDAGGDHGVCGHGMWLKADWTGDGWDWEAGPGWPGAPPTAPILTITSRDEGDPLAVDWTSDTYVEQASVKASTLYEVFPGGSSGTVTGIDKPDRDGMHAISHIVFCYGPEPGTLTVTKIVEGAPEGSTAFDIEFVIGDTSHVHEFENGVYFAYYELPVGTPWGVTELTTGGADQVSYTVDGVPTAPDVDGYVTGTITEGQQVLVTVTNTYVPPPPDVQLEKAWFDSADDAVPVAIFRQTDDGWVLSDDGPEGYVPTPGFVQPADFDLSVIHGDDTYTVNEIVPAGWEPMVCGAEAPMPNGLGDFLYERDDDPERDDVLSRVVVRPTQDMIRHTVCNVRVPDPLVPAIGLTKAADVDTVTYDPGDGDDETVTYTYVVTNTGETALTGLTLVDDVLGTIILPVTNLAAGASVEVDIVHVVTAADAAAGTIINTATTTGTAPDETEVTDTADARVEVQTVEPEVVTSPAISLEKTALVPVDDDGLQVVVWNSADPDATTITYEYVITNTGDTPLTGVTLVDDVLGTIALPATDLAVGATLAGDATHVVTATDAAAGTIINTATTTGTAPDETEVTDTADARVEVQTVQPEVVTSPAISLEKTALVPVDDDGLQVVVWNSADPDATTITYEYVITNTGDTPLTGVTLVDDVLGTIALPTTDLAVGASLTVAADHTVTAADAQAGQVDNEAVTTGTAPDDADVSDTADATVLVAEVRGEVLDNGVLPDVQEKLPAAGAAMATVALAAAIGIGLGAVMLIVARRRE